MRFLRWAYLVPLGFAASQIAYFSDKLPPIIATHFGASGVADGWGSPRTFLGIYAALLVVITLMFCAIPALRGASQRSGSTCRTATTGSLRSGRRPPSRSLRDGRMDLV